MRARDYAEKWWSNQKEEDPHILRRIITALGAPALMSNLTAMKGATFIRSDPVLWAVVIDPDRAVFSSMDLDTLRRYFTSCSHQQCLKRNLLQDRKPLRETHRCALSVVNLLHGLKHTNAGTVIRVKNI